MAAKKSSSFNSKYTKLPTINIEPKEKTRKLTKLRIPLKRKQQNFENIKHVSTTWASLNHDKKHRCKKTSSKQKPFIIIQETTKEKLITIIILHDERK